MLFVMFFFSETVQSIGFQDIKGNRCAMQEICKLQVAKCMVAHIRAL